MELKITWACQLRLQGAETTVQSRSVFVSLAAAEYNQAYGKLEFSLAKTEKERKIRYHQNKPHLLVVENGFCFVLQGLRKIC